MMSLPCRTLAALSLACAFAVAARAQTLKAAKIGGQVAVESLTQQERDMLALAKDLAERSAKAMERWIAGKETSEEKLFAGLYYPVPHTDPPKYTTDWDKLSDRDILDIEEDILARSPLITFAIIVDRFGYIPTHNRRFSLPLTGNSAVDLVNSRHKKLISNPTGYAASRSLAPFLIQQFKRDTGELMADLSVPIFVRGAHWGTARIAYRAVTEERAATH